MSKKKHSHKLKRHEYRNGEKVYFCILNCSFRVKCELAEGLHVVCHRCGSDFVMTQKSCELSKPHCDKCTRSKKRESEEILAALEPVISSATVNNESQTNELRMGSRSIEGNKTGLNSLRERLLGSVREIIESNIESNTDDML